MKFKMKTAKTNNVVNYMYARANTIRLRTVSSFESALIASMKMAPMIYGTGSVMNQSKSCLSGIRNPRQTYDATVFTSFRKVVHFVT